MNICLNKDGKIIGLSHAKPREESVRTINVDGIELPWEGNNFRGWRYVNGEFLAPAEPTEADTLNKELATVTNELRKIFNEEQFSAFLGETQATAMATSLNALVQSRKDELLERRAEILARLAEIVG